MMGPLDWCFQTANGHRLLVLVTFAWGRYKRRQVLVTFIFFQELSETLSTQQRIQDFFKILFLQLKVMLGRVTFLESLWRQKVLNLLSATNSTTRKCQELAWQLKQVSWYLFMVRELLIHTGWAIKRSWVQIPPNSELRALSAEGSRKSSLTELHHNWFFLEKWMPNWWKTALISQNR